MESRRPAPGELLVHQRPEVHYVVEALRIAGLREEADARMHAYWGGVIKKGADSNGAKLRDIWQPVENPSHQPQSP